VKLGLSHGGSISVKPHGFSLHSGSSKTSIEAQDYNLEPPKKSGGGIDSLSRDLSNLKIIDPYPAVSENNRNRTSDNLPFSRKRNISFKL
jgi:hypothetical protein